MATSSNKGLIAVIGGGCVLGLAFALGYLFYWLPKEKAEEAVAEIEEWGQHWADARGCLLDVPARSSDPLTALSARELVTRNLASALARCQSHLKKLARKEGYSTDDPDIEAAWIDLRGPRVQLAQAHAWASATEPNKPAWELRKNLADAIVKLDEAHTVLRKAAKLEAVAYQALEVATPVDTKTLPGPKGAKEFFVSEVKLAPDYITYHTQAADKALSWARLSAEGERFFSLSPLALRAVDADWGLWIEEDGIPLAASGGIVRPGAKVMSGPLDAHGDPGGDGTELLTLRDQQSVSLAFAIGNEERAVLIKVIDYSSYNAVGYQYRLKVSKDGGKSYSDVAIPDTELWVQLQETGDNSYIMWTNEAASTPGQQVLTWLQLRRDGIRKHDVAFPLPKSEFGQWPPYLCQAPQRTWWVLEGEVFVSEPDGKTRAVGAIIQDVLNYQQTLRCTDASVSVASRRLNDEAKSILGYQVCALDGCDPKVYFAPLAVDGSFAVVHYKDSWRVITALDGLAAMWAGNAEVPLALVRLPERAPIYGAVDWKDALHLLVWPDEGDPLLVTLPELEGK